MPVERFQSLEFFSPGKKLIWQYPPARFQEKVDLNAPIFSLFSSSLGIIVQVSGFILLK